MTKQEYNGWFNYETWAWKLWMDNDQGTYDYWRDQARECYREAGNTRLNRLGNDTSFTQLEKAAFTLADLMKSECEDNSPAGVEGAYADLMNAALSEINFHEIASHILEEMADELEAAEIADDE